jgi:endonuclease/exonuclease/phosphatase family metal-dependent hydrolase
MRHLALAWLALGLAGCGGGDRAPHRDGAVTLLVWNVGAWHPLDRDGDFQPREPKPEAERRAVAAWVARENPDLLLALEVGADDSLADFTAMLTSAGYVPGPHRHTAYPADEPGGLVLFSRHPLAAQASEPATYRIGDSGELRARPWLEAVVTPPQGPPLRLLAAHLRAQHPFAKGQDYEVRRNESRLLGQRVAQLRRSETNLLVAGTFNDDPETPVLRQITAWRGEAQVEPLRLLDASGAAWTREAAGQDAYQRRDYLLLSPALRGRVDPHDSRIAAPPAPAPSPHRPLRLRLLPPPPAATS